MGFQTTPSVSTRFTTTAQLKVTLYLSIIILTRVRLDLETLEKSALLKIVLPYD